MQADRADDVRWWFARITFYLAAWILADLVAFALVACASIGVGATDATIREAHGEGEPPRAERAR